MSKGSMTCNRKKCLNITGHENIPVLQANFRYAVIQAVINAGDDPKDPDIKGRIEKLEQAYAIHLEQTGIYISGKNDIPGFRQVVFLGPGHDDNCFTGWTHVIAVTSDFRLVTGTIRPAEHWTYGNADEPITTKQAINALLNPDGPDLRFVSGYVNFNLHDPGNHDHASDSIQFEKHEYMLNTIRKINTHVMFYSCKPEFYSRKPDTGSKISYFLIQQIRNRLAPARRAIVNAIDKDILRDMRDNDLMEVQQGCFLTGGDGASMDVITARQQAVRAYPILSGIFQTNQVLQNVIDARTSLSEAIANHFEIDKRRIKRLSGLTWQQIGSEPKHPRIADHMVRKFLYLPDKVFPKKPKQFQQLDVLEEFGWKCYLELLPDFVERLSKDGNPWIFIDRLKQDSGTNVSDAVQFLARKLLVPAKINRNKSMIMTSDVLDVSISSANFDIKNRFKPGELLDWSDRYHRNIARYEDRLDFISINREWPGMLGTIDLGNDCIARELTSSVALKAQGRAENHCVGGYVSRVLNSMEHSEGQATMIFSIEQNGRILSTAEIRCFGEYSASDDFERTEKHHLYAWVDQNLAYSNASSCRVAEELAEQVAARLQQAGPDAFRNYLDGLHESVVKQDQISGVENYVRACGLDPHNRAHLETVWEELGLALPQRFRRDGLDVFIARGLSSRKALKEPSPGMQSGHRELYHFHPCRRTAEHGIAITIAIGRNI